MTDTAVRNDVPQKLAELLESEGCRLQESRSDMIIAAVEKENLPTVVRRLVESLDCRFITTAGADRRAVDGGFEVTHLFALDPDKKFLILRTDVSPEDPTIPSVTDIIVGAGWAEREVRDMIGVTPEGNPDLRRLVLPDDWPNDVYPLRREFRVDERPPAAPENKVKIKDPPKDSTVLPLGPFFPTLEEPVFINLFVHGEEIVGMDYRGFYSHRGIEKLADSELTYHQVPHIAERICGI